MGAASSLGVATLAGGLPHESGSGAEDAARAYAAKMRLEQRAGKSGAAQEGGASCQPPPLASSQPLSSVVLQVIAAEGFAAPVQGAFARVSLCRYLDDEMRSCVVLGQATTPKRYGTVRPAWFAYRNLFPYAKVTDVLHVELLASKRLSQPVLLGVGECSLSTLDSLQIAALQLRRAGPAAPAMQASPLHVILRRVRPRQGPVVKRAFFLRHGESKWNRAQAQGNVVAMLGQRDHPLNATGIEQARDFGRRWTLLREVRSRRKADAEDPLLKSIRPPGDRSDDDGSGGDDGTPGTREQHGPGESREAFESAFFGAREVLVSPLCRALQTAVLALEGHEHVQRHGVKLFSSAREVQSLLGEDSRGQVLGSLSLVRAREQLIAEMGADEAERVLAGCAAVDPYDSDSEWWLNSKESRASVVQRLEELVSAIQYCRAETVVVVGHSLLFRQLFQHLPCALPVALMPEETAQRKMALMEGLRKFKIENCGCVGVELVFNNQSPYMRKHASLSRLLPIVEQPAMEPASPPGPRKSPGPGTGPGPAQPAASDAPALLARSAILRGAHVTDLEMMFGSQLANGEESLPARLDATR